MDGQLNPVDLYGLQAEQHDYVVAFHHIIHVCMCGCLHNGSESDQLVFWFPLNCTLKEQHRPRNVSCLHPLHPLCQRIVMGQIRVLLIKLIALWGGGGEHTFEREKGKQRERMKGWSSGKDAEINAVQVTTGSPGRRQCAGRYLVVGGAEHLVKVRQPGVALCIPLGHLLPLLLQLLPEVHIALGKKRSSQSKWLTKRQEDHHREQTIKYTSEASAHDTCSVTDTRTPSLCKVELMRIRKSNQCKSWH